MAYAVVLKTYKFDKLLLDKLSKQAVGKFSVVNQIFAYYVFVQN